MASGLENVISLVLGTHKLKDTPILGVRADNQLSLFSVCITPLRLMLGVSDQKVF